MQQIDSRLSSARILDADISAGATSLDLTSVPSALAAGVYRLGIDAEQIDGTYSGSGTTFTSLVRGAGGSTAAAHRAGVKVRHLLSDNLTKLLTVEELDGGPSLEGVRKVVLPNGTLSTSGTTATYTPTGITLAGDSGSSQTISPGDTLTVAGGAGLSSTAGATDTVTVDLNIPELTADASPDGAADYVVTYDASAAGHKKVLLNNLPGGGGGGGSPAFCGACVANSVNQSIPTSTNTALTFDTEYFDTDAIHDTATHNTRMTVPTGKDGYWRFSGIVQFDSNTTGERWVGLLKNGAGATRDLFFLPPAGGGQVTECTFSMIWPGTLSAGDYVELLVWQSSGSNLDVQGNGAPDSLFQAEFLGA